MAGASTLAGLQSDLFIKGLSDNWLTLQKRVRSGESRKNTQQNLEVKSVYPTMGGRCQAYCTHKADFKWGSCIGIGTGTGVS